MEKTIHIGKRIVSNKTKPIIIAEAGVNYYEIAQKLNRCLLDAAKLMVEEAAKAGADVIKFQTYKAESLASKDSPAYWKETLTQRQFFKRYDKFGKKEYATLATHAKKHNIIFLSTPFDEESVDFLNNLMPAFKISSSDITNIPFLKYIAKKKKPIMLSTGASTLAEINTALSAIRSQKNDKIILLHCILSYPTQYRDAHLARITHLRNAFPSYLTGYSDHTMPEKTMFVNTVAAALGACIIEKHFTLDKKLPGNDHYHAMDPQDLRILVKNIILLRKIMGRGSFEPIQAESKSRLYARRSLVAKYNIKRGTRITERMLTQKRPGTGISPALCEYVIGKIAKKNITEDKQILWAMI